MNNSLVWSPVYRVLEERIKSGDDIILILVPFIKLAALQQLHWVHGSRVKLQVICRWRPDDLTSGVSDVEVFTYLKDSGCQLYLNPDIHLKLYVFGSNAAFNTSGNLTLSGLGYAKKANIEVGNIVGLTPGDWAMIYNIIAGSRQVDENLYGRYKAFVEQHPKASQTSITPDFLQSPKTYTISSLPATVNPSTLENFYFEQSAAKFTSEEVRRAMHDLVIFQVPPHLNRGGFDHFLGSAFLKTPFVVDFVALLQRERNLRFGEVNNWIHQKCEDVPLPYRWEIKESTRRFYDWLAHYVPEITWDRPQHSQIIRWKHGESEGREERSQ